MRILLVERGGPTNAALADLLAAHNYILDVSSDGQTALQQSRAMSYALILVDESIAQPNGIELCQQLRSQGYEQPILLLTSPNTNAEIIDGLNAGADDYLIKPYHPEALLARIQGLLRCSRIPARSFPPSALTWGNLRLDFISGKVTYNQQPIPLTATEYNLLELFLQNPDRIFSRSVILDRLWGFDDAPTEKAITTHIKDLRKKLKAGGLTEDLLETVYGIGYRLKPAPPATANLPKKPIKAIQAVVERFSRSFVHQVNVLAEAQQALANGTCNAQLKESAKHEAHKLAGSMGSFGYPEGSKLARQVEHLLFSDRPLTPTEIARFAQLVSALQQELQQRPIPLDPQPQPIGSRHCVLTIDDDTALTHLLQTHAAAWGIQMQIAAHLEAARSYLASAIPDAIVLDLSFAETSEDGLSLLQELQDRASQIPVIVFTQRDNLADRLAVSRLGAKQYLHKPASIEQIFRAIRQAIPNRSDRFLEAPPTSEGKVLIVDDDSAILSELAAILAPWGLEVTILEEQERFWEVLQEIQPNLVIVDLEMPAVSGLELCQVVRQDAHWGDLPLLVVTAHTDAQSLQQTFAAGADDFITKPVLGPELVTRVLCRIHNFTPLGRRKQ
ncbi:response regulator [Desertifilum sp. FACHB-1129]|uniref:Multi-component transcriptional regulator n=1 Tax=Desertifilum tharense IPPAS B-1220 TaxID=1781255 RepID=A0A1E5QD99_9CYAN|nr:MULTISPECIES: response regulator [Desertifilum]MDA0213696.1 response regulator [Cyanobacteria bacterium FC1]MBD2311306.1 response regulator [Desertifilum sp. FACHB-1129]MBD2321552.1 response regulator [Desertifilum sp. FACHB-866]MBD2331679.1 response regulator [Desertifilum sp. FACHB-868]OEJ72642.1 multi-component transcriptional regulator [Desertifilum tharense IPPAS B-1220]